VLGHPRLELVLKGAELEEQVLGFARIRGGCLLALALVVWTTWVGIGLRRPLPAVPMTSAAPAAPH
jgi:hypothetical protein